MLEGKTIPYDLRDPQEFPTQRNRTANYGKSFQRKEIEQQIMVCNL